MLTDKDIEHIAKLARIKILPEEISKIREKLSSIFSYIEKLNNINTDDIQPVFQTTGIVSALRDDKREEIGLNDNLNTFLLKQAPEVKNDFVKVGSVLGRSKK
jgi:aspartyl-tRNA(Asn)/glutamyl-tRNA(Gln) amidotransferase subunit C